MKNWILWFCLAVLWGSSYLAIKIGIETFSALSLVSLRMIIGTILILTILFFQGYKLPKKVSSWAILLTAGMTGNIVPFTLISFGEAHVNSGLAALIMGIAPVVTILIAPLLFKDETLTGRALFGITLGIAGIITLVGPTVLSGVGEHLTGQIAIMGAAICYAFTTLFVRKYSTMPPIVMAGGSMLIGTVVITTVTLLSGTQLESITYNSHSIFAVVYLGIFPTAIATWIYFYLMPKFGPSKMSQINFVVPVVGSLLGIWVLNETLGVNIMVSMVLIMLAIYLVAKRPKSQ